MENPQELYVRQPRFDSVPEFLEWYSSWRSYLDMDRVQRNVSAWSDDEVASDKEDDGNV
jgi:hypothetical protein